MNRKQREEALIKRLDNSTDEVTKARLGVFRAMALGCKYREKTECIYKGRSEELVDYCDMSVCPLHEP